MSEPARSARPGLREVAAAWLLYAVVAVEVLVTYSRVPSGSLYHVTGHGIAGGASRALVFLGFPVALGAIAILGVVASELTGALARPSGGRVLLGGIALAALVLCASAAWPGVVDAADLDARPVNALAAAGVALVLGLTTVAVWRCGLGEPSPWTRADWVRLGLAGALAVAAIPWLAADLGFSLRRVPVLGSMFLTGELRRQPGIPQPAPAVHLGHHHGMDGVLLVWTALLLSRSLERMRPSALRTVLCAYLSLGFVYGLANTVNDFWLEQIVKRGWTSVEIPDLLRPAASPAWAGVLCAAVLVFLLESRRALE